MTSEHGSGARPPQQMLPTQPSRRDAQAESDEPLCVVWFGPAGEQRESVLSGGGSLSIGRDPSNDVVLRGREVSSFHAKLEWQTGQAKITDLVSRNGVLRGGQRVASLALEPGMVLRLGDWLAIATRGNPGEVGEVAPGLLGSATLRRAVADVRVVAESPLNVILTGETGTGKELLARAVYEWSRANGPFVAFNCATLSESLADAQLFGHERGAYSGAQHARRGFIREADRGLLFLDEVGELLPAVQAKLLRALQEQQVTPVGASRSVAVRLRVVAATHRNLHEMAARDAFRPDLLARLEGFSLRLPALRERREDILPLFRAFVAAALGRSAPLLSPELALLLTTHDWPGNVRELKQLADRSAVLRAEKGRWEVQDVSIPSRPRVPAPAEPIGSPPQPPTKRAPDEAELRGALRAAAGVVAIAARNLGYTRQGLYDLLKKHALDPNDFR